MTLLRFRDIFFLALYIITITGKRVNLNRRGGNVLILSNSTARMYNIRLANKYWNYEVMAKVVISVGNLSTGDTIALNGFGPVTKTSCFFLVQEVAGAQRLFSNSCAVDEGKAKKHGCEVVKDLKYLGMTVQTAASPVKKNLLYISYSFHECNADTNVTTKAPSFFSSIEKISSLLPETTMQTTAILTSADSTTGISSTGYVNTNVDVRRLVPPHERFRDHTTAADGAVTNCPNCERNRNMVLIVVTISGTILVIFIMLVVIRCRHNRVPRKESTASSNQPETTVSSVGSPAPLAYRDELSIDCAIQRPSELPEKYIFSPRVLRRPFEFPTAESSTEYYSTPPAIEEDPSSDSLDRVYDKPLQTINLRTFSPGRSGSQTEETAFAYAVSPVMEHQKHHVDASFSNALSELLNSRPVVRNDQRERHYVNQPLPSNSKGKKSNDESESIHPGTDPHAALYHIIVNGTNQQHSYDTPDSYTPSSGYELESSNEHPYDCPEPLTSPHTYAPIIRRTKQHDYVNVLPHIKEVNEQCYEKMDGQREPPPRRKPRRNDYLSMANIRRKDHSLSGTAADNKD